MATFKVNGKEYDLRLEWAGVKRLNGLYEGGSYELIGKAIQGDLNTFPHIIQAALMHTKENFALEAIEDAISEAMASEEIDFQTILRMSNEVVTDSFFYKAVVTKLLAKDKKARAALDEILK